MTNENIIVEPEQQIYDNDEIAEGVVESDELLSPGQLAKFLAISTDKLRYYSNVFKEYLSFSDSTTKGTHRKYTPADVKTLSAIVTMCDDNGLPTKAAKKQLDEVGYAARNTDLTKLANENAKMSEFIVSLTQAVNSMKEANIEAARQVETLRAAYEEKANTMSIEIDNLTKKVEDLTEILKFTNKRKLKKYQKLHD